MKYLRLALEKEVLFWDRVSYRKMFGCPCYKVNEKLFVFLVTGAIVFTHLNETDRAELVSLFQASSFKAGRKDVKNWLQVPVSSIEEIGNLMHFIRKNYQEIRKQTD